MRFAGDLPEFRRRGSRDSDSLVASVKPIWDFFLHIIVGGLLFGLIGFAGLLFNLFVGLLVAYGLNGPFVQLLGAVEYLIFGLDILIYGLFVLKSALKMMVQIWRQ